MNTQSPIGFSLAPDFFRKIFFLVTTNCTVPILMIRLKLKKIGFRPAPDFSQNFCMSEPCLMTVYYLPCLTGPRALKSVGVCVPGGPGGLYKGILYY